MSRRARRAHSPLLATGYGYSMCVVVRTRSMRRRLVVVGSSSRFDAQRCHARVMLRQCRAQQVHASCPQATGARVSCLQHSIEKLFEQAEAAAARDVPASEIAATLSSCAASIRHKCDVKRPWHLRVCVLASHIPFYHIVTQYTHAMLNYLCLLQPNVSFKF